MIPELGGANVLLAKWDGKQKGLIMLVSCQTNTEEHHKSGTSHITERSGLCATTAPSAHQETAMALSFVSSDDGAPFPASI